MRYLPKWARPMIESGRLNQRVTLQSPAGSRDALGERVTTWTDVATVWAAIEPLSTRETFAAAQAQSEATHRVTVRYSTTTAAIGPEWRVKFGTRLMPLVGRPRNVREAKDIIELLCSEGMREE